MNKIARLQLRVKEKATNRTWFQYPFDPLAFNICYMTGTKRLIACGRAGYSEYNDRGEPVLDSWIEQPFYARISDE